MGKLTFTISLLAFRLLRYNITADALSNTLPPSIPF